MKRALLLVSLLAMAACAPVPPPPPPPPPLAERGPPPLGEFHGRAEYIIFFDWNRSWVTPAGMEIVRQAADAYRSLGNVRVRVTGYTDTTGSYRYNQRLSERRAHHVAEALARFGVPMDAMVITGRGENDLRVPTPKGVPEAQNRRVEVIEGP
ncbi:MAG: OmpA family protein [Alphaproteobacteria bacterium]|nr:OmpA family protein [Alphaproteobacteria bacterium]